MSKLRAFLREFVAGDWISAIVVVCGLGWVAWNTTGNLWNIAVFSLQPPFPESADLTRTDVIAQRSMSAAAWWMVIVTSIAAAVGAASLALIALTLREARRSADAARDAVEASNKAVSTAREMGQAQVRAYMIVKSASATRYHDGSVGVDFRLFNSGQTPASVVSVKTDFWFEFRNGESEPWAVDGKRWVEAKTRSDIPSGENRDGRTFAHVFLTDELFGMLARKSGRFLVDITLSYRDVFGVTHDETAYYGFAFPPMTRWQNKETLYRIHL